MTQTTEEKQATQAARPKHRWASVPPRSGAAIVDSCEYQTLCALWLHMRLT